MKNPVLEKIEKECERFGILCHLYYHYTYGCKLVFENEEDMNLFRLCNTLKLGRVDLILSEDVYKLKSGWFKYYD